MKKITLFILLLVLFAPHYSWASRLYLESNKDTYSMGESFAVNLKLDVDNNCINTVSTKVVFPKQSFYIEDFISGQSLINIWLKRPSSDEIQELSKKGEIEIAGGIPGGYCGEIPGDPGDSNLVGTIIFRVPGFMVGDFSDGKIDVKLEDAIILQNDGLGTLDNVVTDNLTLNIRGTASEDSDDILNDFVQTDKLAPEPFVIELHQKSNMFDGKYFVVFNTSDKQTGIDRYMILEYYPEKKSDIWQDKIIDYFKKDKPEYNWELAKTPYLLKDQTLQSIIKVKAIDKAGNERQVEYIPESPIVSGSSNYLYLYLVLLLLSLLIILIPIIIILKIRKNK